MRTLRKFVIGLVVVALLGAAGWWGLRPLYRGWQERRHLAQVKAFLAEQDDAHAALAARRVLQRNPRNVEACRIMADLAEKARVTTALTWRQRTVDLEPNVPQHRLDLAQTALRLGRYADAARALANIPTNHQNTVAFHQLSAMVAIGLNQIALADYHLSRARELDPQNKSLQFNLAVIHLQARNQELVRAARQTLEQLRHDPAFRKDALRHLALAAMHERDYARTVEFTRSLVEGPQADISDQLLHLTALREAGHAEFEAERARLQARAFDDPNLLFELARWQLERGLLAPTMQWLNQLPDAVRTRPPAALVLAECYLRQEDWTKLEAFLAGQNWDDLEFNRRALLARAARAVRRDMDAQAEWRAAVRAAADRPKAVARLAGLAAEWNWTAEKEELLWTLIQRYPGERWALTALERYYRDTENTRGLLRVYSTAVKNDPSDVVAANNFATAAFLLNTQTAQGHELARKVNERHPEIAEFATTYAYSLHLQGRPAEALAIMNRLPAETLARPDIALFYGVILAASDRQKAEDYLRRAESGRLLPEERELIARVREK